MTAVALVCEVARTPAELDDLAADWQRLAAAHPRPTVFYGLPWCRAALAAFGAGARPCVVVARRHGRVVGLLPLLERAGAVEFLGSYQADYNDLLGEDDAPGPMAAAMLGALRGIVRQPSVLRHVPGDGLLAAALADPAVLAAMRLRVEPGDPCPAVVLDPDDAAQLAALAGKQSLRRHERRLQRRGTLTFAHLETRAAARAMLPELARQHRGRRAAVGDGSLFDDASVGVFYERLVAELDPAGELRFAVLAVDGRPVALHFGFETAGRLLWYKPAFDVDLASDGPGEVLIRRLLLYAGERRLRELDFTRGDEAFKSRFANVVRRNLTVHLLPGSRGLARSWLLAGRAAASRRPWLRSLLRRPPLGSGQL